MSIPKPARTSPGTGKEPELTRADWLILERCFEAEIESALAPHPRPPVYQTRSKRALVLAEAGYLQELKIILPGRFPVTVTGWALTEYGRICYCFHCPDSPA